MGQKPAFGGHTGGAPRRIPAASQLLRVIRAYCLECCGGERSETARCTAAKCRLYPYRMGPGAFAKNSDYPQAGGQGHLDVGIETAEFAV